MLHRQWSFYIWMYQIIMSILRSTNTLILHLKSGLKHSTYSVVMHSLCIQDTKSPSLPKISLSFVAQKLIQNIIIDKYCAFFVSWIDHKTIYTATITVTLHWSITPSRQGNCTGMLVQTVPQQCWDTMMTRGQKPLPCLNLCLNDSKDKQCLTGSSFLNPWPIFFKQKPFC